MKISVKLFCLFFLLMLSFSVRGDVQDLTVVNHWEDCSCVDSERMTSGETVLPVMIDDSDAGRLHVLSFSDVELGVKLSSENFASLNNQRLRKGADLFCFLKKVMHCLCRRENLLVLDKCKTYQENYIHDVSSSCDYYVFALRRILI